MYRLIQKKPLVCGVRSTVSIRDMGLSLQWLRLLINSSGMMQITRLMMKLKLCVKMFLPGGMRKKTGKPIRAEFSLLTISGSVEMANTIISEMPIKVEKHGAGHSHPPMKPE